MYIKVECRGQKRKFKLPASATLETLWKELVRCFGEGVTTQSIMYLDDTNEKILITDETEFEVFIDEMTNKKVETACIYVCDPVVGKIFSENNLENTVLMNSSVFLPVENELQKKRSFSGTLLDGAENMSDQSFIMRVSQMDPVAKEELETLINERVSQILSEKMASFSASKTDAKISNINPYNFNERPSTAVKDPASLKDNEEINYAGDFDSEDHEYYNRESLKKKPSPNVPQMKLPTPVNLEWPKKPEVSKPSMLTVVKEPELPKKPAVLKPVADPPKLPQQNPFLVENDISTPSKPSINLQPQTPPQSVATVISPETTTTPPSSISEEVKKFQEAVKTIVPTPTSQIRCDLCNAVISGTFYHSLVQKNYDLCETCEAKGIHEDPMIKIQGVNLERALKIRKSLDTHNSRILGIFTDSQAVPSPPCSSNSQSNQQTNPPLNLLEELQIPPQPSSYTNDYYLPKSEKPHHAGHPNSRKSAAHPSKQDQEAIKTQAAIDLILASFPTDNFMAIQQFVMRNINRNIENIFQMYAHKKVAG